MLPRGRHAGLLLLAIGFALGAVATWLLYPTCSCARPRASEAAPPTGLALTAIPGWSDDDVGAALVAFQRSCRRIAADPGRFMTYGSYGKPEDWAAICADALTLRKSAARAFFEDRFVAMPAGGARPQTGKITGYYEPELKGSRLQDSIYTTPLYGPPVDLVTADPDAFRDVLHGNRLAGKVFGTVLEPFDDRAAITTKGLVGRAQPIVYLDDPIAAFFVQIQGSGRVKLAEGGAVRIAYAAQNGRPYTAIGGILVSRGDIARDALSMQTVHAWLTAHPDQAADLMNQNQSYVFFHIRPLEDPSTGPDGAEGVPLTPGRSLAVDDAVYPFGLPIFVVGQIGTKDGKSHEAMSRLMIAQDTGGAITGRVRGDVFFGWGPEAEARAGKTAGDAVFYILQPKPPADPAITPPLRP